jgi:hypothetical protein
LRKRYMTYAVVTHSTRADFPSGTTVRRRFSDVVLLDSVLKVSHRGYFIPPRPLKHVTTVTGKLKDSFVSERRHSLELYLNQLCSHKCATPLNSTSASFPVTSPPLP